MHISSSTYNKRKQKSFTIKIRAKDIKSTFGFRVMPCTRIQKIIIDLANKIGIKHLSSSIQLYKRLANYPINKSGTVDQAKIKPNELIIMKIDKANADWTWYTKTHDFETIKEYKKYLPKKYILPGLNLNCMCVNPNCVEYGKAKVVPKGSGHFDVDDVMNNTFCEFCPDRKLGTNPQMAVKNVVMVSCYWRYEGKALDEGGFERTKFGKGWVKVENCDEKNFAKLFGDYKWKDLKIVVRGL